MDDPQILYSEHDGVHFLRFRGNILHDMAPMLEDFLDQLERHGAGHNYLLDLTETYNIDSTMLGLLARIANRVRERGDAPPTLVCSGEDIIDLLIGIGFDQVFQLMACDGAPLGEGRPLKAGATDHETLARTMLNAHKELIALKDDNRLLFDDVIQLLEGGLRPGKA